MKKEKTNKYEKGVIIVGIVVALILVILLVADGIKNKDKKNTVLALSEQEEIITDTTNEPNVPTLSAGMIPVKYEEDNLKICENDNTWYNYEEGKPAYMMLNDGVYQSELVENMTNKKLASENIGETVTAEEQGSIYMWIPRYANKENGETSYIKQEAQPGGDWIVPDMFSYKIEDETKPDYSLAGIWIEKEPLANTSEVNTKITNMKSEDNIYGLIANTVVVGAGDCPVVAETWLTRTVPDGIIDPSNTNRTILKIINTNKVEPIKAKAKYNQKIEQIEIQVTYNKNGIEKIIDEEGNTLSQNSTEAITGDVEFGKTYTYTIIDKAKNKKQVSCKAGSLYGKKVKNYTCANQTVSTWRIFHVDEDDNIYLIADDYVPYGGLPTSTYGYAKPNRVKNSYYKAYFTDILSWYRGSEWIITNTNEQARKWLSWVDYYQTSVDNNIKATAYMMDTKSWSGFAGEKAEYAIGGPTIELFCASYKVTHPDIYLECNSIGRNGYQVKWSNESSYANVIGGLIQDDYESIYIKNDTSKALGMWLASPSDNTIHTVMCAQSGRLFEQSQL